MTLMKFTLIIFLALNVCNIYGQNIHYYGWDSSFNHIPEDIIETSNGNFLITGSVNSTAPVIENFISQKYLVQINVYGDTIWTNYHTHSAYGGSNIIEGTNNSFLSLGRIGQNYSCGFLGQSIPFHDYCQYTYTGTGQVQNTTVLTDNCENVIIDYLKNDNSGITTVQYSNNPTAPGPGSYTIKELSTNGQLLSIPFPHGLNTAGLIEKNASGYWLLQYDSLHRIDLSGNILWQTSHSSIPYIADFCKIQMDSLLIAASNPYSNGTGLTTLMKTDSLGNLDWTRNFYLKTKQVLYHSSGNYILTGESNDNLQILIISPQGDSLLSRYHPLIHPAIANKTIEATDGKIITLAQAKPDTNYVPSHYVVVIDSFNLLATNIKSIKKNQEIIVKTFPNPNTGFLNIKLNTNTSTDGYSLKIYNNLGQLVYKNVIFEKESQVVLKKLSSGIYTLQIDDQKKIISQSKLIIQN